MNHIRDFVVVPALPASLEPLRQLAYNLWWCWNPPAMDLFRRLDVDLWQKVGHNPVALLGQIDQSRLEHFARDDGYIAQLLRVSDAFYIYMNARTWFQETYPEERERIIAYFSAEFGLHECMQIYSGGLGVLAGDHLKSASDLGIPLVGVGLMYRQGYFVQQIAEDGWQLENYPNYDFHRWPATPVTDAAGAPLRITLEYGHQQVVVGAWLAEVGRVKLYLMDTDLPENPPEIRAVTARLYGGDSRMRLRQEILLGVGGLRILRAMGIRPTICHMNEGHAAFLALERIRQAMRDHQLSFREAREAVVSGNLFTTHTPVPAGIDKFDQKLIEQHLSWMPGELGISMEEMQGMGRENPWRIEDPFCMPILALRLSFKSNGVSKLHGEVARGMWQSYWPGVPRDEIPITHITNGIHTRTWMNPQMADLFDQYLGPNWQETTPDDPVWKRIEEIPDGELWRAHVRRRERMIVIIRRLLRNHLLARGAPPADIKGAEEVLDSEVLTIGFARRFAPYKRATLLFRDPDRLAKLLLSKERPVQFIFSGKSHPADGAGKELIKQIVAFAAKPEFRRKFVFLENYDMGVARAMVQGVDVWLNNPLRLHEASGTSGMKVVLNGGLNLSALDGWWPEAYNGENGWAIGDGRVYDDVGYQDHVEGESLYTLLERELIPTFYERSADDLPRTWIARVKNAMRTIGPVFSTNRMLREYCEKMYMPAARRERRVADGDYAVAKQLAHWKDRLRQQWHQVRVVDVGSDMNGVLRVGDALTMRARVHLGSISPDDVTVEIYHGRLSSLGEIETGMSVPLLPAATANNGEYVFEGRLPCQSSGRHGYSVRVVPRHKDLVDRYDQGFVVWG